MAHYVASKGAVVSLTRAMATGLARYNVLVNSVAPGFTMSEGVERNPALVAGVKEPSLRGRVLARDMLPADLVGAVAFFCRTGFCFHHRANLGSGRWRLLSLSSTRTRSDMQRIPIIDVSAARTGGLAARQAIAREIDATCREIGFFTVTGHGVPVAAMDELRSKAHTFFALPLEEKCKAIHPVPGTPRGYRAQGLESLAQANAGTTPPDLKEFYHFGRESWPEETYYTGPEGRRYFIPNFWPATPERFANAAAAYYAEMEKLAGFMMQLTALALGLEEHFFNDKIDKHVSAMRLNF